MLKLQSLETPVLYLPILHDRGLQLFEISVITYRNWSWGCWSPSKRG